MPVTDALSFSLAALFATIVLHVLALRLFPRLGLLDFPERYGLTRPRIPYPTGILAVLVFLIFFIFLFAQDRQDVGLIVGIIILASACFRDDRRPLSPAVRLLVQILAATVIFLLGTRIYSLTNPLGGVIALDTHIVPSPLFSDPSLIGGLFTVGWLLLTINALNWFDGIPGQVSLLSVVGFSTIGCLALFRGDAADPAQQELAHIAFVLAGIALGGLLLDFPPARVLMGDTGAMFFGLLLGTLTIYSGGKVATAFLVLGVPLIDSLIVALGRMLRGQSAMAGGRDHLHHKLLDCCWSQRSVVLLTAFLGTSFGVTALFLTTIQKFAAAAALALLMALLHAYAEKKRISR
jgi:UDP-GlcNAc:undecaprenyl-phosphate GlcNAc-1-phosphate transferase